MILKFFMKKTNCGKDRDTTSNGFEFAVKIIVMIYKFIFLSQHMV